MKSEPHPIRVLVADDDPVVRHELCDLLEGYPDMQVIGTAEDGPSALAAAKSLAPDVMLLDVSLPGLSGIAVARKLCHSIPSLRIIMLTGFNVGSVVKTVDGNAHGVLFKSDAAKTIGQAIRGVYRGERWMAPSAANT